MDFQWGPLYKPEHQLPSGHGPQFLALRTPLLPDSQKVFFIICLFPISSCLHPSPSEVTDCSEHQVQLRIFPLFHSLQLVVQVIAPGEAPKILGSSFKHSRKISQFLTCGPFWLVFILAVPIAVLELISDTDSKFCFLGYQRGVDLGE